MSALPPKADMCGATRDVRYGPKADIRFRMILIESITAPPCVHRRIARHPSVMRSIEDGATARSKSGGLSNGPSLLWPKPLDLRLERRLDRPVRRLNGDHARRGI